MHGHAFHFLKAVELYPKNLEPKETILFVFTYMLQNAVWLPYKVPLE